MYSDQDFQCWILMGRNLTQLIIVELCQVQPLFSYQYMIHDMYEILVPTKDHCIRSNIILWGTNRLHRRVHMYGKNNNIQVSQFFYDTVADHFVPNFLRKPTQIDEDKIVSQNTTRGFRGMLSSLDCMHWMWQICLAK